MSDMGVFTVYHSSGWIPVPRCEICDNYMHDNECARCKKSPIRASAVRCGRNDKCYCGSGVKFKKCCMIRIPDERC
jgi:hypothetical protein